MQIKSNLSQFLCTHEEVTSTFLTLSDGPARKKMMIELFIILLYGIPVPLRTLMKLGKNCSRKKGMSSSCNKMLSKFQVSLDVLTDNYR